MRREPCTDCHGTGRVFTEFSSDHGLKPAWIVCWTCDGTGRVAVDDDWVGQLLASLIHA
jgi:DnaJ-class molecular chaperone